MSDGHGAGYEAGGIMANKNLLREIGFGVLLKMRLVNNLLQALIMSPTHHKFNTTTPQD